MTSLGPLVIRQGSSTPMVVLRETDTWGLRSADLVHPQRRFWGDEGTTSPVVEPEVDARRLSQIATPAQLLKQLPLEDNWTAQSKRSLARLWAYFLICEDPQRRLDARKVNTLSHQVSIVRHILDNERLRRVLIADEVGLGKTVEAGLLIKELLGQNTSLRVLYLAPARLVGNVRNEFERLGLPFRQWSAVDADARLTDPLIIASIHRAVHGAHQKAMVDTTAWDLLVVDECHHLSDWAPGGGDPKEKFKLVRDLISRQSKDGRVVLLSGTPHQGHISRFENLIGLLCSPDEPTEALSGRVIYRTKDEIQDWDGNLLFPRRTVNEPLVVDLGARYRGWITSIHQFYKPPKDDGPKRSQQRAAGWRCAQALQWAASSPHAGLGYLVRQAIRAGWLFQQPLLQECLEALRPYRGGPENEPVSKLFERIVNEIRRQKSDADVDDIEDYDEDDSSVEGDGLANLLRDGLALLKTSADEKWKVIVERILKAAGDEKVVLFAQPIETVTALANYLKKTTGEAPALIIGGQSDAARKAEVDRFWQPGGPQYLVSSRAGGEGINLQVARRLVHIDVPWNPMDMEQRVGRVHRFGSRRQIIVDTLVVKDSREADAYQIARERLRLIASVMVEKNRFESVFSRVMCLVPPQELQDIMINDPTGPLTDDDQERLSQMVHAGFETWNEFDKQYSQQQKQIRQQDSGLATWNDVVGFTQTHADTTTVDGFVTQRFALRDGDVESVNGPATVVRFPDGSNYVCGDTQGVPVFGPQGQVPARLGLNVKPVADALRKAALPGLPTGAAHLRWPSDHTVPPWLQGKSLLGLLIFVRQTIRTDSKVGWAEAGNELHIHVLDSISPASPCPPDSRRLLIDGLLAATIRVKPETDEPLLEILANSELEIGNQLRRPSPSEIDQGIRHAVTPLLAATIVFDKRQS